MGYSQATDNSFKTIQVFPIHRNTFQGIASNLNVTDYKVIHADEDTKVTLYYVDSDGNMAYTVIDLALGEDIGLADKYIALDSTGTVKVS
jgi:hypothetical protein